MSECYQWIVCIKILNRFLFYHSFPLEKGQISYRMYLFCFPCRNWKIKNPKNGSRNWTQNSKELIDIFSKRSVFETPVLTVKAQRSSLAINFFPILPKSWDLLSSLRPRSEGTVSLRSESKWSRSIWLIVAVTSILTNRTASFRFGTERNRNVWTWSKAQQGRFYHDFVRKINNFNCENYVVSALSQRNLYN